MPGGASGGQQPRETIRPPWIRDGPPPIPMPTAPWAPNRAQRNSLSGPSGQQNQIGKSGQQMNFRK